METVIGLIAVMAVTYMIVWMRRNARGIKAALEGEAASALAAGSTMALVAMAFLAVLREGLETSVFLLAAFQNSTDTTAAGSGAVLGLVAAVAIGLGLYRGGVRINLSRFFRITGVVLVFVAAGPARDRGPHRPRGGLGQRPAGPGGRPLLAGPARHGLRLAADRDARAAALADRDRGARLPALRGADAALRRLARPPPAAPPSRRQPSQRPGPDGRVSSPPAVAMTPITRRRLLASAGLGAAGIGLGAGGYLVGQEAAESSGEGSGRVPFYGEHQAGIDTPAQDRLHFAAFDLLDDDPAALRELMREWSRAAAEMTVGEMIGDVNDAQLAPPEDTGETVGLAPSRLTVTFGFGPGLFERPRLGLGGQRPAALRPIPPLPGDELDAARKRRRPLRAGLLRRSPGRLPRHPQPGPDRPRHGGDALVPARLRPHLDHQPQPGHPAQPDGDEGRDRQHPRRGHGGDATVRLGLRRGAGLDARRQLHGHPPHPHAARGLGPRLARRPGADDRPPQVQRRAARAARTSSTRSTSSAEKRPTARR